MRTALFAILFLGACGETTTMPVVGVDDPSKARPLETTTSADASTRMGRSGPIPAQGGPPLDGSVVPPGVGWFCFDTPSSYMQCERTASGCDQDHSAALGPGIAIGECTKVDSVFAFTLKDTGGTVRFYPYATLEECLSPVFGRKNPNASGCAELH